MLNVRDLVPDAVDRLQVFVAGAGDGRTRVVDDIGKVIRRQAVVDRDEDGADLWDGVEGLELRVDVRRNVRDPVTLPNAEPLEGGGPAVAAVEELLVGEPETAVHDRLPLWVQAAGPAHELERRERRLYGSSSPGEGPALMLASVDRRSRGGQG